MKILLAIDADNLFRTMKDHLNWWIDPGKLKEYCSQFGEIIKANYYTSIYDDVTEGRDKFHRVLVHMGFSIIQKKVKHIKQNDGSYKDKASMDVIIARDICLGIDNYDMLILVSGDGDFVPVLEALDVRGKLIKVISTSGIVARDLREFAGTSYIDFEDIKSIIERSEDLGGEGMADQTQDAC